MPSDRAGELHRHIPRSSRFLTRAVQWPAHPSGWCRFFKLVAKVSDIVGKHRSYHLDRFGIVKPPMVEGGVGRSIEVGYGEHLPESLAKALQIICKMLVVAKKVEFENVVLRRKVIDLLPHRVEAIDPRLFVPGEHQEMLECIDAVYLDSWPSLDKISVEGSHSAPGMSHKRAAEIRLCGQADLVIVRGLSRRKSRAKLSKCFVLCAGEPGRVVTV